MRKALTAAAAALLTATVALAAPAGAQDTPPGALTGDLAPLNDSGATGTVEMELVDNMLTVRIESTGLTPGAPHAQHIHGTMGEVSLCPEPAADEDGDGLITTAEGVPSYGSVLVALTTEGDTGPDSGLAVDRFPVAGDDGTVSYERTFEIDEAVSAELFNFAVVQHGIDLDDSGTYDGDAVSSLDPSLPLEATIPANCGTLVAVDDVTAAQEGDDADGDDAEGDAAEETTTTAAAAEETTTTAAAAEETTTTQAAAPSGAVQAGGGGTAGGDDAISAALWASVVAAAFVLGGGALLAVRRSRS